MLLISHCAMSCAAHHDEHWCVQNVLLDGTPERPLLKICDFGYSKNEYLDSRPKSLSGTPDYIAPEVPADCNLFQG